MSSDKGTPWFVGQETALKPRPVAPNTSSALRATPPLAPQQPEAPLVITPLSPSQKKTARPAAPSCVNWRTVAVLGGIAWVWVVGVIIIAWMAGGSTAAEEPAPVATVAPIPQPAIEKPIPVPAEPAPAAEAKEAKELVGPPAPTRDDLEAALREAIKPVPEPVAKIEEPAKNEAPGKCGTAIDFMEDPIEAKGKALNQHKILFVVHVSGDFEDPGFT
jgi:hypothetical protein